MKYYIHNTPGRLRVRIPELRGNAEKLEEIKTVLDIFGTEKIKVNALTGSIVVHYDPDMVTDQYLLDHLQKTGYYDHNQTFNLDTHLKKASNEAAHKVSRAMFGWAMGKVLEANGLGLIAVFI